MAQVLRSSLDSLTSASYFSGGKESPPLLAEKLHFRAHSAVVKRAFDIAAATTLLVCFAPVMLLIALAVACDSPGGVFFRQERLGKDGKVFRIWKFRTMVRHDTPSGVLDFVKPGDPRITRLGKFLRNTSLDELPQLFNVLHGEMSMVGPRPQPVCHLTHFGSQIPEYPLRLAVKPGITGLVQVSDLRSCVDSLEAHRARVLLDIQYILCWTLAEDIRICLLTALTLLLRYNVQSRDYPSND